MNDVIIPVIALISGIIGMCTKIAVIYDSTDRKTDLKLNNLVAQVIITIFVVYMILLIGYYQQHISIYYIYSYCAIGGLGGSKSIGLIINFISKNSSIGGK